MQQRQDFDLSAKTFGSPAEYSAAFGQFLDTDSRIDPYRSYRMTNMADDTDHLEVLQQLLFDEGWSRLGWPQETGGLGGDPRFRAAMFETLWSRDVPIPEPYLTLEILVPVMLVYAPDLAAELLPALLRGDDRWAQAFSEPDAGSDLAALRTKMEPADEGYRISGQKVWSSFAHVCDRAVTLVRTGEPGHRGLSMVLIDLDQPGVQVVPTKAEDGVEHFSEIFFDNAAMSKGRVIGELGQGWAIAMYMLQWERGAWAWLQQGHFHNRLGLALQMGEQSSATAAAIGQAYVSTSAVRVHTRETVRRLAEEEELGPEVSVDKLILIDAELAIWDAIRSHLGVRFDTDPELEWLREEFLYSRAAPIYGGSQEIQRTLVAQRVLGMPRK